MCLLTTFGSRLSTCYSTRKRRVYCLRCSYSRASTGNFSPPPAPPDPTSPRPQPPPPLPHSPSVPVPPPDTSSTPISHIVTTTFPSFPHIEVLVPDPTPRSRTPRRDTDPLFPELIPDSHPPLGATTRGYPGRCPGHYSSSSPRDPC